MCAVSSINAEFCLTIEKKKSGHVTVLSLVLGFLSGTNKVGGACFVKALGFLPCCEEAAGKRQKGTFVISLMTNTNYSWCERSRNLALYSILDSSHPAPNTSRNPVEGASVGRNNLHKT